MRLGVARDRKTKGQRKDMLRDRQKRLSDADFDRIFEAHHGEAARAYYAMPVEPRSAIGSTLDPACFSGFVVGRRLRTTSGEIL
jgi:hypothetical protein